MPLRLRYSKVLEVRRLFDGHDSVRVETISEEAIPAFARKYAARLYALEKSEKAPKVMSTVMRSWGLSPRARREDQFLPEQ